MTSEAIILLESTSDEHLGQNLAKLASALGLVVRHITFADEIVGSGAFLENFPIDEKCLLTTSRTLDRIFQSEVHLNHFREAFLDRLDFLFVVGFSGTDHEQPVLDMLTKGALGRPLPLTEGDHEYTVGPNSGDVCPHLAGMTFGPVNRATDFGFVVRNQDDRLVRHIQIGSHPFFVEIKNRRCRIFLLACSMVADIDDPLSPEDSIRQCFSHLVPGISFLRYVFGPRCWHSPERLGCFIIDDPLLRKQYGFLEFGPLSEEMERSRFSTSIAFIPWNYRRTKPAGARLFKERPDNFSLSVHGCNHTEAEYGTGSHEDLLRRTRIALQRMALHKQATGVDFDRVMVFPMGHFSTEALRVLKSCGFLGVVNTAAGAVDQSKRVSIREFLEVPALQYEGFSLFLRRYPKNLSDFALDLFLGKPVLIVEHHDYFKEGPKKLADFVGGLNRLAPGLQWCGLGSVLERARLEKNNGDGVTQVKFYTRVLRLKNRGDAPLHYVLRKCEGGAIPVSRIIRDGVPIPFTFDGTDLTFEAGLAGGTGALFEVEYAGSCPEAAGDFTVRERIHAAVRRHLSEFRDNRLSKNEFLLRAARRVKSTLFRR